MKNDIARTKELFGEALNLSPSEREKFLDEKCKDNPDLKKEILALISSHESSDDFLEQPLVITKNKEEAFQDQNLNKQIGNYLITGEAGVGGMGVVYSAVRNDEEFEQKAAVKILKHGITSEYLLKRFQVERQTLANLQHENIARLLDGGRTEEGLPYLVMEYIDGIPITSYCNQNNLNVKQRLELFRSVCSAVQYAHKNLIIHRDIKPGNILVSKDGKPKLLDFGIAKLIDEDLTEEGEGLTKTGMWHLTPEYACPEQIKGEKITTASDIYSLGVLLYELLTGELPYKITNTSPVAISKIITDENIPKPSDKVKQTSLTKNKEVYPHNPERVSSQLKGDLDNIVLKAMHKEPERRYESVEQYSEDIKRYITGLPVIARKDTTGYRLSKFIRRHKVGFVTSVIFALFLIGSLIAIIWQANLAAEERDKAQTELEKFEEVNNFLLEMLASPDPSAEGKDIKVYDLLEKATTDADIKLRKYPKIKAAIKQTLGSTFIGLGDYEKAEQLLMDAHNFNKKTFGYISEESAKTSHQLGLCYDWIGNAEKSDSFYLEGIKIYRQLPGDPPKGLADNMNDYGSMLTNLGEFDSSEVILNRALEIYKLHGLGDGQKAAVSINNLAVNMHHQWKVDEAEKYYIQAKNMLTNIYGENRPEVGSIYNNLAFIYLDNKKYEQSEQAFIKSYEIKKAVYDDFHPYVGLALINLGMLYFVTEDYEKAETPLIQAKELYISNNSLKDPFLAFGQYWLGRVYLEWGKLDKAERELRNSLMIREEVLPENNYKIWSVKGELGVCLLRQNKLQEAEKYLISALNFYKEEDRDKTKIKSYTENAAILYKKLGDKKLAASYQSEFEKLNSESSE